MLFVWVQVAHSFDVPARRDLLFSLAGSAEPHGGGRRPGHRPRASASTSWPGSASACWGLIAMWSSASDGGRISARGVVATLVAVVRRRPPPSSSSSRRPRHVAGRSTSSPRAGAGGSVGVPGGLAGRRRGRRPARPGPGSPAGRTRVGGYLGFANQPRHGAARRPRATPSCMRVRAQRPSYWIGETFDTWEGESWTAATSAAQRPSARGLALRPPRSPSARSPRRPERPADLLHRAVHRRTWCSTPTSAARGLVPDPEALRLRRRHHRLAHRARARGHLHRRVGREHAHARRSCERDDGPRDGAPCRSVAGGVRAAAPPLPAGPGPGRVDHRRRARPPTTRCRRSSPGSARTPTTPPTSLRCRPAPTPSTSSSSATGPGSASRSPRRWP